MTQVIKSLAVRAVSVPMTVPHRTASGQVSESPLVLIDIATENGVVGHSLIFTYTKAALQPTAALVKNIGALVVDRILAPTAIEQEMTKRFRLLGTQGLVGMALAAIDMALWDVLARSNGVSLARLLGGEEKSISAYAGVGYDGAKGSAQAAEAWVKQGFTGVKAKIGYPSVKEDLAVVRAMRSAVGDDVAIMVDYNQCLLPSEAVQRLRVLNDQGLTWVEEPTLAQDYAGHALVSSSAAIPIQCGENWWGVQDMQHAIDMKASDYIMADVMKIGGVTGWMRAASLAQSHGLPLSSHLWPEVSAQLLSVTPTAHWLEYVDWWNPVLLQPLRIERGMADINAVIGSGIEWNEDAINRYRI